MTPRGSPSPDAGGRATPRCFLGSHGDSARELGGCMIYQHTENLRAVAGSPRDKPRSTNRAPLPVAVDSRRCPDLGKGSACGCAVFCDKFAVFLWCEPRKNGGITRRNEAAANFPFWTEIRLVATGITSFEAGSRAAGARFSPCERILGGYGRVSSRRIAGRASFGRVANFYFFCGEWPNLRRPAPSSPRFISLKISCDSS